jgi:hypothetical protein
MTTDPTDALRYGARALRQDAATASDLFGCYAANSERFLHGYVADLHTKAAQLDELADLMPRLLIHGIILKGRSNCE